MTEAPSLISDPAEQRLRLLKSVPPFQALPAEAIAELASKLEEQAFAAGALVVAEGDPADRLFVIAEGEVAVSMAGPAGQVPLSRLGEGELFGEVGLLAPLRRRSARVTATRPLLLACLSRRHFEELAARHPATRAALEQASEQALSASLLKRARPFERLEVATLRWLSPRLLAREFAEAAWILQQGDPGDECYMLRSGEVELLRREGSSERCVARLFAGDVFGEAALLTEAPRDASARAVLPTRLLALRRDDLLRALRTEERFGRQIVELMRQRERPLRKDGVKVHPRPTPEGGTLWVLEDTSRFGAYHQLSPFGLFVWRLLDGRHNVEEIAAEHRRQQGPVEPKAVATVMAELIEGGFAQAKTLRPDVAEALTPRSLWGRLRGRLFGR